jgi:hypothetical protein
VADDNLKKFLSDEKYGTKDLASYTQYLEEQNKVLDIATMKTKAFAMAKNLLINAGIALASYAITKGIELAANAIDHYVNRAKYAAEAMEEAQQKIDDAQDTLKTLSTTLSENKDRFIELSQGVDKFSRNLSLSEDDYAEYLSISNKLADLSPSLISGYDDQGNALLLIGNNAEETTQKLNELLETQQTVSKQTLIDNLDDVAKGVYYEVEQAKDEITELQTELEGTKRTSSEVNIDIADTFKNGELFQFSDVEDPLKKNQKAFIEALESANIKWEQLGNDQIRITDFSDAKNNGGKDSYEIMQIALQEAQEYYDAALQLEKTTTDASIAGIESDIADKENSIKNSYSKMTANLQAWVEDSYNYQYLSDSSQELVNALIPEIDWDSTGIEYQSAESYQEYINKNILQPLMKVLPENKDEVNKLITELLSFEDGDLNILDFAKQFETRLNELGITIDITPIISNEQEAKDKLQNSIRTIAVGNATVTDARDKNELDNSKEYEKLQKYTEGFNAEQIELWSKVTLGITDADKAIRAYEKALEDASDIELDTPDVVTPLDDIKTAFSDFEDIYEDIHNGTSVAADSIEKLSEAFGELDDGSALQDFKNTLTTMPDDIEAQQEALNKLATAYIDNSDLIKNLTEDNADYVKSELKKIGVINSDEVVQSRLYDAETNLSNAETEQKAVVNSLINSLGTYTSASDLAYNAKKNSEMASIDLANASLDEVAGLINAANAAGTDSTALQNLISDKIKSGQITLTTNGDITNLVALVKGLGKTVTALEKYSRAKTIIANGGTLTGNYTADTEMMKGYYSNAEKELSAALNTGAGTTANVQYQSPSTTTTSGGSSGSGSSSSDSKTLIDWIDRRITVLTTKAERWAKIIENATDSKKLDSYYKKLETNYKKQVKTYSDGATRYLQKANSIKLSSSLKNKVKSKDSSIFNKDGSMKSYKALIKEYDETTAQAIQDYESYLDDYESALDNFIDATENLYQAPIEKAADKIELLSDSLSLLEAKAENISVDDYKKKNNNLDEQNTNAKKQLEANQQAEITANKNLKDTKKSVTKNSNLSSDDLTGNKTKQKAFKKSIKKSIKNGEEIDLTLYKEGSSGYKAAVKYNAALKAQKDASQEAALAQEEYTKTIRENEKAKFDNIQTAYESKIGLLENKMTSIDNQIAEVEARGMTVNASYYKSKQQINNQELAQYQAEKTALEEQAKNIKKGTDEWYAAQDAIQEVDNNISKCVQTTYELNDAITKLKLDEFDNIAEGIDRVTTEQEFLQSLFAHESNTDDETGGFTEAGLANLGSTSAQYYLAKGKQDTYKQELQDLQNVKANGKQADGTYKLGDYTFNSLEELQDQIDTTYTTYQDAIKETYQYESDIVDLMKEKYQAELDLIKELIDQKKNELSITKDLHDYQKEISEKSTNVETIRKQILAYQNDSSQEGKSKLQSLQSQLNDAVSDLEDTEYDRMISDQQDMLDNLYDEYSDLISKKLDDFSGLVEEGLSTSNDNTAIIGAYLSKIASSNGYTEETTGLFDNSNISDSTKETINKIETSVVSNSGTDSNSSSDSNDESAKKKADEEAQAAADAKKGTTSGLTGISADNETSVQKAKDFIASKAHKATKKKSEYGAVNQAIYDNKAKAYSGTGKVLSVADMKTLSSTLGVTYDNAKKSGKLYKKLKSIGYKGFKTGGIAQLVKSKGEDGITLARNGEGFIAPENVSDIQELLKSVPIMNDLTDSLVKLPDYSNLRPVNNIGSTTVGDMVFNIDMQNVTNAEEIINAIQTDQKVQKALRSVTTDRIAGGTRLGVNKIK